MLWAAIIAARLRTDGPQSFAALTGDAEGTIVVVARFLALLELFRDAVIAFDQDSPLGELTVRWTGPDAEWSADRLSEEYEDPRDDIRDDDQGDSDG